MWPTLEPAAPLVWSGRERCIFRSLAVSSIIGSSLGGRMSGMLEYEQMEPGTSDCDLYVSYGLVGLGKCWQVFRLMSWWFDGAWRVCIVLSWVSSPVELAAVNWTAWLWHYSLFCGRWIRTLHNVVSFQASGCETLVLFPLTFPVMIVLSSPFLRITCPKKRNFRLRTISRSISLFPILSKTHALDFLSLHGIFRTLL